MAIVDYGTLKTAVALRLGNRTDLTSIVPDFVSGGLARLNQELIAEGGLADQELVAYTDTVAATENYAFPTDFGLLRYIRISTDPLESVAYDRLIDNWGDNTGTPEQYAFLDSSFYLRPIPDAVYRLYIGYVKTYSAFAVDADTNWLITSGGNVLLYASLLEAAPHIQDDQIISRWSGLYKEALRLVMKADKRARRGPKPAGLQVDKALMIPRAITSILTG